ncbi:uncharacterized protein [Oscarella lobularis]|uniref:uncharacterized protein isoform X2 n=1 Tax=Oscarella lobularis TaxID=121494 RepID=UPI003313B465
MAARMNSSPLPPGWEMKYDQRSRRYFFINHATKTTSWADPRTSIPLATKTTSFTLVSDEEIKNLKERFPNAPESQIRNIHTSTSGNVDLTVSRLKALGHTDMHDRHIDTLSVEFPRAGRGLIESVLRMSSWNLRTSRTKLKDMGYAQPSVAAAAKRNQEAKEKTRRKQMVDRLAKEFPHVDKEAVTISLEMNGYNVTKAKETLESQFGLPKPKQKKHVSFPSELTSKSQADKNRILAAMTSKFPSLAKESIKLALELVDYDENIATDVLRHEASSEATASATTSYTPHVSPPPSPVETRLPATLSPVTFGTDDEPSDPSFNFTFPSTSSSSFLESLRPKSPPKEPTREHRIEPPKRQYQPHRYERQPVRMTFPSNFKSKLRTPAQGPDLSLWHGPDESLLSDSRVFACGPDKSLARGPNRGNHRGPAAAHATQTRETFFCGPQASHFKGADPNLHKGPAIYVTQ